MKFFTNILLLLFIAAGIIIPAVFPADCKNSHKDIVVIDAGTTGTRHYLYDFYNDNGVQQWAALFQGKSKIRLAQFNAKRADWTLLNHYLDSVINLGKNQFKRKCLSHIRFYVQCTAGMRMLKDTVSKRIMDHIRRRLSKSGYKFSNDYVALLPVKDEAKDAFVTLNYLLHGMDFGEKSVGTIELGGGSLQLAFEPAVNSGLKTEKVRVYDRDYQVYSAGYDGLGMDRVRLNFYGAANCLTSSCPDKVMKSECMKTGKETTFRYGAHKFKVNGKAIADKDRFKVCYNKAMDYASKIKPIGKYMKYDNKILVTSAMYYILKGAGTLTKYKDGTYTTTINTIMPKVKAACENPKPVSKKNRYQHFQCMDLSYVLAVLNRFDFNTDQSILAAIKVKTLKLNWALGFAILHL